MAHLDDAVSPGGGRAARAAAGGMLHGY
jgi:hypothetical protein